MADERPSCGATSEKKDCVLRIALIIPALSAGGAERVAATLCNRWAALRHDVHIVTFEQDGTPSHYDLDPRVRRHLLDLARHSRSSVEFVVMNLRRVTVLRAVLRRIAPDIAVSFMPEPNVIAILAGIGRPWPVVVSERVHPRFVTLRPIPAAMRRLTYPFADRVVAQTAGIAEYVARHFGGRTAVLPNPIDLDRFKPGTAARTPPARQRIVSIGRLDRQKGFDLLIDAFAAIAARHPDWDLTIFGEGDQRAALEAQIAGHGLGGRVRLPGVTTAIASELQATDIYAHASRFEGYPNAIMEALACGCPVIATDSPGGARELLQDGRYGRLVPVEDVDALAHEMNVVMGDFNARATLRAQATCAVADLAVETIAQRWIDLFREVLAGKSRLRGDAALVDSVNR